MSERDEGGRSSRRIIVSGVSGSGKSTVGVALADRLGLTFRDGDEFHSLGNIDKMTAGIALDDDDRWPWLRDIGAWLHDHDGVVACSALKRSYRELIRTECPQAWTVQLSGDHGLIDERQAARHGHFMPASLMDSQWAALEPLDADERGAVIGVGPDVDVLVDQICAALHPRG